MVGGDIGTPTTLKPALCDCRLCYNYNYYTSVSLAHELLKRQTHLVGTVRKNRKMNCATVTTKKLKKHEQYAQESNTGITMLKWHDTRDVLTLSTKHTAQTKTVQQRGKEIEKPVIIVDYNECKSFIDLSDQMKAYSHCLRRGTKWYRKLALELLFGSAMVNAFIVFKKVTQSKITITDFKKEVALALLGIKDNPDLSVRNDVQVNEEHILTTGGKKNRCTICYSRITNESGRIVAQNKTPRSKYQCSSCQKFFCVECFFQVHRATKK